MTHPKFKTDLLITVEMPFTKIMVDELITNKLIGTELSITVLEINRKDSYLKGEWIPSSTIVNLYISDNFIHQHFKTNSDGIPVFLENLAILIEPLTSISAYVNKWDKNSRARPFAIFSTFYKTKEDFNLQFYFAIEGNESDYIRALTDVFTTIVNYKEVAGHPIQNAIKKSYNQSNRIKYLFYIEKEWTVLNPLLEVGSEINFRYRKGKDIRIKKPYIIIHRNDFAKYLIMDSNWVLNFDGLETMMIKPNDVALYSSISDKNLNLAEAFYNETILPRHKVYHGQFPSEKMHKEYYDYFELI